MFRTRGIGKVGLEDSPDDLPDLIAEILAHALAVRAAKKMINQSYERSLSAGLVEEKQEFYNLFASEDQKEGMQAFIEKRQPVWKGR